MAVERWHLSYEPLACDCDATLTPELLASVLSGCELELGELVVSAIAGDIRTRYNTPALALTGRV